MAELNQDDIVANRFGPDSDITHQIVSGWMNGQEQRIPEPIQCERCGEQIWLVDVMTDNGDHLIGVVERCTEYPPEEEMFWAHVCEVA
jgi:hypothetical protein